jgi:hypothetical protein
MNVFMQVSYVHGYRILSCLLLYVPFLYVYSFYDNPPRSHMCLHTAVEIRSSPPCLFDRGMFVHELIQKKPNLVSLAPIFLLTKL